jgi:hypothetical protein
MPTNTQVIAGLVAQNVPPDRECVRNGTEVLALVQDYMSVNVNQAEINNGTDSVAQQALETANAALATAQQALAATPNRRSSGEPIAMPTGDSVLPISWAPAMPDTNYEVRLTYYGANIAVAAYYAFRVVDGSRTVNSCQIRLDNTPANTKIAWVIDALPSS